MGKFNFIKTDIPEVQIIEPTVFGDDRGYFMETYQMDDFVAAGIDSIEKAYFPRALYAYAYLWREAQQWPEERVKKKLLFTLTSLYQRITKFSEFRFWGGSSNIANYNVPHIINEQNVFRAFERKAKTIYLYFRSEKIFDDSRRRVFTSSACSRRTTAATSRMPSSETSFSLSLNTCASSRGVV